MPKAPTHRVSHPTVGTLHIYIAPDLQTRMEAGDPDAHASVCIRFRSAAKAKARRERRFFNADARIAWTDLVVVELPGPTYPSAAQVAEAHAKQAGRVALAIQANPDGECCDNFDCRPCDDGYHGSCRDGCTRTY